MEILYLTCTSNFVLIGVLHPTDFISLFLYDLRELWKCVLQASEKISTEFPVGNIYLFWFLIALIICMIAICWDWVLLRISENPGVTAVHHCGRSAVGTATETCLYFNYQPFSWRLLKVSTTPVKSVGPPYLVAA